MSAEPTNVGEGYCSFRRTRISLGILNNDPARLNAPRNLPRTHCIMANKGVNITRHSYRMGRI